MKRKGFCPAEETVNRANRQAQNERESLSAPLQTGADAQNLQRIVQVKHQGSKIVRQHMG